MTSVTITITGARAEARKTGPLTSGMVGVPVQFVFDPQWEGLNKIPVFKAGNLTKDNYLREDASQIPHEVLCAAGEILCIGVEGRSAQGDLVIPTVWAEVGKILPGAQAAKDASLAPTPCQFDRFMAEVEQVETKIEAALEKAKQSGVFDGEKGTPGTDGKSAYNYAVEGGYTGTEEEFADKLAEKKHLPEFVGASEAGQTIVVKTIGEDGVPAQLEAVNMTAEDVRARPDTWMPTAEDVGAAPASHAENKDNPHAVTAEQTGARPNTWMPTPAEIGAAPSAASADHPGCYYRMVDGEEEWVNPPMCLGVEYRTTGRYNDKAVYTKLIDCGTIPASGRTVVSHNLGCRIIRMEGSTSNGGTMPYRDPTVNGYIDLGSSSNNLVITTSLAGGTSPGTGAVQLWYVKA